MRRGNKEPDFFFEKEYIKRCVGLPGDEISVRDGNIVVWDETKDQWNLPPKTVDAQGHSGSQHGIATTAPLPKTSTNTGREPKVPCAAGGNKGIVLQPRPESILYHHPIGRSGHGDKGPRQPFPQTTDSPSLRRFCH